MLQLVPLFAANLSKSYPTFNCRNITYYAYALSVYAACESDVTLVKCFLNRCFKRKCTSKLISVYSILERQDRNIFKKVSNSVSHPLLSIMPCIKSPNYNLTKKDQLQAKNKYLHNSFNI